MDEAALRYHPNRLRLLYSTPGMSEFVEANDGNSRTAWDKFIWPLIEMNGGSKIIAERLFPLDSTFEDWIADPERLLIDASNQMDGLTLLPENDWKVVGSEMFEDPTYIHFGKIIDGYEGFYAHKDPDTDLVDIVMAAGGFFDAESVIDTKTAAEAALTFGDSFSAQLGAEGYEEAVKSADGGSPNEDNISIDRAAIALRVANTVIRRLAISNGSRIYAYAGDAPFQLTRRAAVEQAIAAGKKQMNNSPAEDMLSDRGWFLMAMQPASVHADQIITAIDHSALADPASRTAFLQSLARTILHQAGEGALSGYPDLGFQRLAQQIEEIYVAGTMAVSQANPYQDLIQSPRAGSAAWILAEACYGSTPGGPILEARYIRSPGGQWKLRLSDDSDPIHSVPDETMSELASTGLISIKDGRARPTSRLRPYHSFRRPQCMSAGFGNFDWSSEGGQ